MTYGHTSRNIDRVTRSAPRQTQWQQSRMRGPILGMDQPKRRFLSWIRGR